MKIGNMNSHSFAVEHSPGPLSAVPRCRHYTITGHYWVQRPEWGLLFSTRDARPLASKNRDDAEHWAQLARRTTEAEVTFVEYTLHIPTEPDRLFRVATVECDQCGRPLRNGRDFISPHGLGYYCETCWNQRTGQDSEEASRGEDE